MAVLTLLPEDHVGLPNILGMYHHNPHTNRIHMYGI